MTHPADVAYGGHEEDGEHKMVEHRCPAIWRGEKRLAGRCTWPMCKDANGACAYSPLPAPGPVPSGFVFPVWGIATIACSLGAVCGFAVAALAL